MKMSYHDLMNLPADVYAEMMAWLIETQPTDLD